MDDVGRVDDSLRRYLPGDLDEIPLHVIDKHGHAGSYDVFVLSVFSLHQDLCQHFGIFQQEFIH